MTISRREFCGGLAVGGSLLAGGNPPAESVAKPVAATQTTAATGSHLGNLYPFVQRQADRSPLALGQPSSSAFCLWMW